MVCAEDNSEGVLGGVYYKKYIFFLSCRRYETSLNLT